MSVTNYEIIGKVIYGVGRLDAGIGRLSDWMTENEVIQNIPGEKHVRWRTVAKEYFSKKAGTTSARNQYNQLLDEFLALAQEADSMGANVAIAGPLFTKVQDLHQKIEVIYRDVGCNDFPPGFFSEHPSIR